MSQSVDVLSQIVAEGPPELLDYDIDGNGKVRGAERRAYKQDSKAYRQAVRQLGKTARTDSRAESTSSALGSLGAVVQSVTDRLGGTASIRVGGQEVGQVSLSPAGSGSEEGGDEPSMLDAAKQNAIPGAAGAAAGYVSGGGVGAGLGGLGGLVGGWVGAGVGTGVGYLVGGGR